MSRISGIVPFSVAEILMVLFFLWIFFMIVISVIRIIRKTEKLRRLITALRDLILMVGIVFLWYMIGCGTNYYRYEFTYYSGLKIEKSTVEELYGLVSELVDRTNEAREELDIPDDEVFKSSMTDRERAKEAKKALEKLSEKYEVLEGYFPKPKNTLISKIMSEFNITGFYFPWTVEANVNCDIPDYSRAAVMCHELSHLRGFMREDEANFIGYLACVNSDNAELRYSGLMLALVYAGNKLYDADRELYFEVRRKYNDGIVLDFADNSRYWDQYKETVLSEVGESVNNTYLKANSVEDGTKSYGRMVDLLLAEFRSKEKKQ